MVLTVLTVLTIAPPVTANPVGYGGFTVYPTTEGIDGTFYVSGPALVTFYVVHYSGAQPAMASQFSAPVPACLNGVWMGDLYQFDVIIGDSQTGISIGYGVCMMSPIYLMAINVFVSATPPDCCFYELDRDPTDPHGVEGEITVVNCEQAIYHVAAGRSVINPDPQLCPTPVEASSWGRIKALYVQ